MVVHSEPVISVCMITYNHGAYISQAIEGVLMQQTDFPYELIIGEDVSTDNTRAICEEYQQKYPDKIKLLPATANLGMMSNFVRTYLACKGKYIALCEGDDFWNDPIKLQSQYNTLEANKDINLCFHKGDEFNQLESKLITAEDYSRTRFSFSDFAAYGCIMKTMSVVFRNDPLVLKVISEKWVLKLSGVDQLLYLLLTINNSSAKCINKTWGVYRMHPGGVWSASNNLERSKMVINDICLYKKHLNLSFSQEMYLNWQLRKHLLIFIYAVINFRPQIISRGISVLINRLLTLPGPGIVSGMLIQGIYKILKGKLKF